MLLIKQFSRRFCDTSRKPNDSYIKPISGFRKYISNKFFQFIQSYERILEKRFPNTFKVYQIFKIGIVLSPNLLITVLTITELVHTLGARDFTTDSVQYFRISRELFAGKEVNQFSYNELMVYFQMPKDMLRVGPVLLVSALPFANYIVFPLAYFLPKQLLSHHFWTIEQKQKFQIIDHTKRLYYYRPVFRHLQSRLSSVTVEDNLQDKCGLVFAKLGSGTHPSVQQILDIKQTFVGKPFGIQNLKSRHLTNLCRMYGLNAFPLGRRSRLQNHIGFVRELDLAINRDGIQTLNFDQIKRACFMRGLNPISLSKEEMISWLQLWITIAQDIDSQSLSLLLHCPLFLAYNNPSNWRQIH